MLNIYNHGRFNHNIVKDNYLKGLVMRIQNYALSLEAKAQKEEKVTTSFTDTLEVENSKKTQELKSVEDELAFVKQLQYDLLNQLMNLFNRPSQCSCEDLEFQGVNFSQQKEEEFFSFEQINFSTRTLSFTEQYSYKESLDVSMKGFVQTANQKIELDMNLSFSSEFTQTYSIDKTMFYDPLVINYDGTLPELDSKTFDFDIDMNGESDQISMLKHGSGFLALDRDENGKIDDGYELFGTQNGNGFLDLKRYDEDSNGWIDENDDIFDKLRIWSKNEDEDTLVALGEKGIGALYLGYAKGEFNLNNDGETLGKIKSNGFFLNEDGTSGLLTQIDFAKQKPKEVNNISALSEMLQA